MRLPPLPVPAPHCNDFRLRNATDAFTVLSSQQPALVESLQLPDPRALERTAEHCGLPPRRVPLL